MRCVQCAGKCRLPKLKTSVQRLQWTGLRAQALQLGCWSVLAWLWYCPSLHV